MANDPSSAIAATRRFARDTERNFFIQRGLRTTGRRGRDPGESRVQRVTGRDVMNTRGQNVEAARRRVARTGRSVMNPAIARPARRGR